MTRARHLMGIASVVSMILICCSLSSAADKQKPANEAAAAEAEKPKWRLPDHYAAVIDEQQRQRIYGIQANYAPQIEKLQAQLSAVLGKRNAEIRAVLTPEQQIKVDELTEAEAKKQKESGAKSGDDKAAVDAKMIDAIDVKGFEKGKKGK